MRLALLRHGNTAWNRAGRIQGRTDMPLDPEARAHLSGLCLPNEWRAARLFSSPLIRAVETAKLVAGRDPEIADDLIEQDWGVWEGQRGVDLRSDPTSGYRDIEDWGLGFKPPSGEGISCVMDRVRKWAEAQDQDAVVVCHIGVMRAFLAGPLGWNFSGPPPVKIKRDRLYVIEKGEYLQDPVPLERRAACGS